MLTSDPFDILRISLLPNIGPNRGRLLLKRFGSYEAIRRATKKEILQMEGFNVALAEDLVRFQRDAGAQQELEKTTETNRRACEHSELRFVPFFHDDFPSSLKALYDPPLFLFFRGDPPAKDEKLVAIVGTRVPTEYGKQAARKIAQGLSELGVTIVSGLALGIDSAAHAAALEYGARTVAVLGSGLNVIYPFSNRRLAEKIPGNGCLVSEFPINTKPDAPNFPRRNRIISGLSLAVIVVEGAKRGGAIITAELALDQNKEVFAVPGSIFSPQSEGTNELIRKGCAHVCTTMESLLEELPLLQKTGKSRQRSSVQLTFAEQAICDVLGNDPMHIDDLALRLGMQTSDLLVQLLQLEFKNVVKQLPGKHFICTD
jgi:DNA processing protein